MQAAQHGEEATEMGEEWKKPWGLGPSERKSHRENHGSSSATRRGRRSLLYVAQELHVQGESAARSCVRTRPSVLRGLLQTAHVAGL